MILATDRGVIPEHEYGMLVRERERLKGLDSQAVTEKHKSMVKQQLDEIRNKISKAHHERYKQTGQA